MINDDRNHGVVTPARPGRRYKTTPAQLQSLNNYLIKNTDKIVSLKSMNNHLMTEFKQEKLCIHEVTVFRMLKELNISRKKSSIDKIEINSIYYKQTRLLKTQSLVKILKNKSKIIYLDESLFNTNLYPLYRYAKKDQKFKV